MRQIGSFSPLINQLSNRIMYTLIDHVSDMMMCTLIISMCRWDYLHGFDDMQGRESESEVTGKDTIVINIFADLHIFRTSIVLLWILRRVCVGQRET